MKISDIATSRMFWIGFTFIFFVAFTSETEDTIWKIVVQYGLKAQSGRSLIKYFGNFIFSQTEDTIWKIVVQYRLKTQSGRSLIKYFGNFIFSSGPVGAVS